MSGRSDRWLDELDEAFREIRQERVRQVKKWGFQLHTVDHWIAILAEEVGELAKASLESDYNAVRLEAIQVAAVAAAIAQAIVSSEGV